MVPTLINRAGSGRVAVRRSLIVALTVGVALGLVASPASAGVANAGLPHASRSNPLVGMTWGVYRGSFYNSIYPDYAQARGRTRQLLAKIALKPLMYTFGDWFSDSEAKSVAQDFIQESTHGNPAVLSQAAIFRLDPWEGAACPHGSWNAANQQSYRTWINNFAAGIGKSRAALIVQPDLPFAEVRTRPFLCSSSTTPRSASTRCSTPRCTSTVAHATSRRSARRCRCSSRPGSGMCVGSP
jgi:endoglucanase